MIAQHHEFSHTIIHGRPGPGRIVVAATGATMAGHLPSLTEPEQQGRADNLGAVAGADKRGLVRLSGPAVVGGAPKLSGAGMFRC